MKRVANELVLQYAGAKLVSSNAIFAEANGVLKRFSDASAPFPTLNQTVSALKGDVPGGSLERLGEASRYLTVVWNASVSEPRRPLCGDLYMTRLSHLYRRLAPESQVAALQLEQHVRNAMAQLSNEQLRLIESLFFEDRAHAEISAMPSNRCPPSSAASAERGIELRAKDTAAAFQRRQR